MTSKRISMQERRCIASIRKHNPSKIPLVAPIFNNPSDNCPLNHPQSKIFEKDPKLHLQICKCDCTWCNRAFGMRRMNWGTNVL